MPLWVFTSFLGVRTVGKRVFITATAKITRLQGTSTVENPSELGVRETVF